ISPSLIASLGHSGRQAAQAIHSSLIYSAILFDSFLLEKPYHKNSNIDKICLSIAYLFPLIHNIHDLLHVPRDGELKLHILLCLRMDKTELHGMEHQAPYLHSSQLSITPAAVCLVSGNRVVQMAQMYPQLVCPACLGSERDECCIVVPFDNLKMGNGMSWLNGPWGYLLTVSGIPPNRQIDDPAVFFHNTLDQGHIDAVDRMLLKLFR